MMIRFIPQCSMVMSIIHERDLGKIDLMLTGASAVSKNGVRFGKGHGFFDLEWGMFVLIPQSTEYQSNREAAR